MSNQLGLARFAFNIYGSLGQAELPRQKTPDLLRLRLLKKFTYSCEKEIICVSQLRHPLGRINTSYYDAVSPVPSHHVVIGGKNYLKLLALNSDQNQVIADINMVDLSPLRRFHTAPKLFNVNTIKCNGDMVACGLTDGTVSIFQVTGAGKAKLAHKFSDHKRVVNSMDFVELDQILLSGSQDGTVKLWDLRTFNQKPVLKLRASQHSDPVRACQYSPFSRSRGRMTVLSVHDSGALCKFDFRYPGGNSQGGLPERKWTFHTGPALSLHIHPEREYVLTGGRDHKICLWGYEDSAAHHSVSPKVTMNAYGPVMKVRWSEIPNGDPYTNGSAMSSRHNLLDFSDNNASALSLYNYDFACSYLNDDPTITVFNLRRKYIPKEVITTSTEKPVQNFIWANNPQNERKLWAITKSNVFVSYNLSRNQEDGLNISRPLDELTSVATAWSPGYTNLSFTNQEKGEFYTDPADILHSHEHDILDSPALYTDDLITSEEALIDRELEHQLSSVSLDSKYKMVPNSISASNFIYQKSPKDRPLLVRLSTYNPSNQVLKLPSPNPQSHLGPLFEPGGTLGSSHATHSAHLARPPLTRNPSQSTQGSGSLSILLQALSSGGSALQQKKVGPITATPSPYFVAVSLPIPLNDEAVFEYLAYEYFHCVPDGSSLAFVCQMNAQAASAARRFRDCQVWRMLATAIEQSALSLHASVKIDPEVGLVAEPKREKLPEEQASINSDLGNLCGSYDLNSTLTTNFRRSDSNASVRNMAILSSSKESTSDFGPLSPQSVMSARAPVRNGEGSLDRKSNSHLREEVFAEENDKDENVSKSLASDSAPMNISKKDTLQNQKLASTEMLQPPATKSRDLMRKRSLGAFSSGHSPRPVGLGPDLDDENLHVFSNSYSSSGYQASEGRYGSSAHTMHSTQRPSFSSSKASPVNPHYGFKPRSSEGFRGINSQLAQTSLDKVEESSIKSSDKKESGLTKAIQESTIAAKEVIGDEEVDKPWSLTNLLHKAITYARDQGDLVMCSTMIMLFYGKLKSFEERIMDKRSCLECLGLYVESLRRTELFAEATDIVKSAPLGLKKDLSVYASREVDMRFFCDNCNKLLTNERTKELYAEYPDKFGFWYCDECSSKQRNCVYCNEPCKGLTVVVGLKCGHSGHFGCLQEWFLVDEYSECPAGCDQANE